MPMQRAWTADEENRLRTMAAEGLTADVIAARLSRTKNGVRGKAKKLGITFTKTGDGRALCKTCYYRGARSGNDMMCDFYLLEGQRRGCPIGNGCKRYREGRRRPNALGQMYRHFEIGD